MTAEERRQYQKKYQAEHREQINEYQRKRYISSLTAKPPTPLKSAWKIKKICKNCHYRRAANGCDDPSMDWSNTACCYNILEDELRGCTPTDDYCEKFKRREKNGIRGKNNSQFDVSDY